MKSDSAPGLLLHERIMSIGRSNPRGRTGTPVYLKNLDYSVLQQCIHCGLCLPTCPTYDETQLERNSPRGRIALMRSIADGSLEVTDAFGEEMYFCLGCLACQTACPAGVNYAEMFEHARADIEQTGVLDSPMRQLVRSLALKWLFTRPRWLHLAGRLLRFYQESGLESFVRGAGLTRLLPSRLRDLERLTPRVDQHFSQELMSDVESPTQPAYRVGLLTGCVQDLIYAQINRDTADVLLQNNCTVVTPRLQPCCGSLHAHNGELELAREMARRNIDSFHLSDLDAIITNAAGCGSHLKNYAHLLANDPAYAAKAREWSSKLKDIHEWLATTGLKTPAGPAREQTVTYHEACHLCHGQKITAAPRALLRAIPGLRLVELKESMWCCGSAGIYNITQPEMSRKLLARKIDCILASGAECVATANPGCLLQINAGLRDAGLLTIEVCHPVSLLAQAYRR